LVQFGKLKLSGFKSFVDATELYIDPGMTGIVGPNGCGKSNLVEALRWVMGENSPKRMRGGGMEDVIFSGSSNRPSRNVAEVVLSLDNSDRKAPAHFNLQTDIEVSRRIERGEGSAYRVNGKEVRARDVQLLFADSATGAHSTALVSQGRVGALINAKPIERRALLEEAAGITGLHSRRHEAELRLRAAETNLERLDDIVATLESQLQGLKKQARQASRYRNLARHIRRHEALLLHLQGLKARHAKEAAEAQLAEAERTVGALMENTAAAATDQAEAAGALPDLRQVEAAAATALQRLLAERTALEQEEARVTAAQDQAAQRLSQIEGDQQRAKTLSDDAAAAQNRLAQERHGLEAAIEGEAELRSAAHEAARTARETLNTTENALSAKAGELAAEEARNNAVERRAKELTDRIERLRGQFEAVEQERAGLGRAQQDEGELKSAELAVDQVESLLATRKTDAEAASAALADAREAESAAREAWRQAETERSRLEAEISALAVLLEPKESEIWPPLVDAVTVEAGYEAALGAALGDDLDAPADEAAPIHWAALGDFLGAPDLPHDLPAGARALSEVVRAPGVLSRRLSQIGVVADLATGARLQKQLSPGQRLVTRDGALWRWDGFAARPDAPTGAAARLAQRTRLADLRQQIGRATETAGTLRDRLDSRAAAAQSAAESERLAREAQASAYAEMDQTRQSYARLSQASVAAASRLSALGETAQRLQEELSDSETAREQNEADRTALPQLETLRAALQALRSQAEQERNELADRQAEVARLERERESRQQRLTAIGEEAALWERRAAEATQHLSELAERWQETGAEIESLKALPAEIEERRSTLAGRVDAAEAERKSAMDTLAVGESRLAEADKALRSAEQKLAQAREERVRAEGANEQADQALTLFRERVRERLECQLDQLAEVAEIDPSQDLPAEEEIEMKLGRLTRERENVGAVNLLAEQEAEEVGEQIDALQTERADLVSAIARLRQGIAGLNKEGRARLLSAFEDVNRHFSELFVSLFGGGRAHLALTEADDPLEAGLEIMASPPGKRLQVMSLLSGGEQALTALSLLFAVFLTNPAPICVLDEVDAPLDDANVDRFCTLVQDLAGSTKTRFLIITHHRMTMARMDRLYGVTMSERGVSQLVSVDLGVAERLRETA
jgi:chromosome segregation protein